jgi:hypothetical protein
MEINLPNAATLGLCLLFASCKPAHPPANGVLGTWISHQGSASCIEVTPGRFRSERLEISQSSASKLRFKRWQEYSLDTGCTQVFLSVRSEGTMALGRQVDVQLIDDHSKSKDNSTSSQATQLTLEEGQFMAVFLDPSGADLANLKTPQGLEAQDGSRFCDREKDWEVRKPVAITGIRCNSKLLLDTSQKEKFKNILHLSDHLRFGEPTTLDFPTVLLKSHYFSHHG